MKTASIHRRPDCRGRLSPRARWHLPLLALALCLDAFAAERVPLRGAISKSLYEDVNRNDAEAAIKVWGGVIAAERGVAVAPQTHIVDSVAGLRTEFQFRDLFVSVLPGGPEETYVVVTHREGGRARLTDLAGTRLGIHGNPRFALAEPWLDVELAAADLPRAGAHFSLLQRHQKPAKAELPVFFRQAEAALVSQRGFETMVELNPQLGRTLQIIARSPAMQPMVFALVEGIDPALHRQLLAEHARLPGGGSAAAPVVSISP